MCGGMQEESAMGITPHKLAQRCNISDRHLWCVYVIWTILYMHTHAYTLRFFSFLSCCRLFFSYFVLTLVPCFTFLLLLLLVLILGLWNADHNYFWSDGDFVWLIELCGAFSITRYYYRAKIITLHRNVSQSKYSMCAMCIVHVSRTLDQITI